MNIQSIKVSDEVVPTGGVIVYVTRTDGEVRRQEMSWDMVLGLAELSGAELLNH
jgi:hypothetical protein